MNNINPNTIKELLIKLLDQIKDQNGLSSGLCLEIGLGNFSDDERIKLLNYIDQHRPIEGKHFDEKWYSYSSISGLYRWYWPVGEVKPRVDWLKDEIEKL